LKESQIAALDAHAKAESSQYTGKICGCYPITITTILYWRYNTYPSSSGDTE